MSLLNIYGRKWGQICYFDNRILLVVVDYYSNYIEVCRLQNQVFLSVIKELQNVFARFGVPYQLVADNGPQSCTEEFTKFTNKWAFQHITSS